MGSSLRGGRATRACKAGGATAVLVAVLSLWLATSSLAHGAVPQLGDRTLALGSWGADVFALQQALIRAGYDLVSDGLFGRATQRAVMAFQLANNLNPDGIVGPKTVAALRRLLHTEYVVQPGDTLSAIAARFGTSVRELARLNGIEDPDLIFAGASLVIPSPAMLTVQDGL